MRILMVTPMPPQPQPTNGVPLVTYAQLMGLREHHEVTLVTVAGPDPAEIDAVNELRAAGIEVWAICRVEPQGVKRWQRRIRLASVILSGKYPFRTGWYWEPQLQNLLDRLLSTRQFDVIQLDDNAVGIYRYRTSSPIVLTEYEVRRPRKIDWHARAQVGLRQWIWEEQDWNRWSAYQRNVWKLANRLIVFTERDAAAARTIAPDLADRVRINPFGIVLPQLANVDREEQKTLVFIGGYSHRPNVDAAFWLANEIMPRLRQLSPGVRLFLVGSEPPSELIALGCNDITVTGRVSEVEPWLERATVVLAPVRIGGGMRTKVLQAMAMGKAVVTTPLGAEGLKFAGDPPLVIADDAEAIARATAGLLASQPLRHNIGTYARAFVAEHYSPQAYARRLTAIYTDLLFRDKTLNVSK